MEKLRFKLVIENKNGVREETWFYQYFQAMTTAINAMNVGYKVIEIIEV